MIDRVSDNFVGAAVCNYLESSFKASSIVQ